MIRIVLSGLISTVLVALLLIGNAGLGSVSADAPHAGLSFALGVNVDGDGDNDCGTGVPTSVGNGAPDAVPVQVSIATCEVRDGSLFKANVYIMTNDNLAAAGMTGHIVYDGVTSTERGDSVWDGCTFEAAAFGAGFENTGCSIGLPPAAPAPILGLFATFTLRCTADGSVSLGHGEGETSLTSPTLEEFREAGPDLLTIDCVEGLPSVAGDSDCSGSVNSIDAALILQNVAGLLANIPCAEGADANHDGTVNSIDAALVLQFSAGILHQL